MNIPAMSVAMVAAAITLTGCGNGGSASPITSAHAASSDAGVQSRLPDIDAERLNAFAARALQQAKGGLLIPPGEASAIRKSSGEVTSKALAAGWNLVDPEMCLGAYSEQTFYMTVVATDGSMLIVVDPSAIAMLAPACVDDGKPIIVNVTSQIASGVYGWAAFATVSN